MDIFRWLDDSTLVESYVVHDFRQVDVSFYLHLPVRFHDQSSLHVWEYADESHRKYSFHWQNSAGALLVRWDNAPHFRLLPTFPHHKHLADGSVEASHDISFDDVMHVLRRRLTEGAH